MRPPRAQEPGRAEAPGERIAQASPARWDFALVCFMRLAALAWLAKGVANWALILGALPGHPAFEAAPVGREAAVVYFGVVDCVSAVGLWLASAWGGVVWLFAATSAVILAVLAPDLAPLPPLVLALCAGSVVLYFVLSWLASRERQ